MKKISVLPAKRCGRRLYKMSWYLVLVIIQDDARMCRCINRRRYTVSILGVLFGKTGQYMASFFTLKLHRGSHRYLLNRSGAQGVGSTSINGARSNRDFSAHGTVQSNMVLQVMPLARME